MGRTLTDMPADSIRDNNKENTRIIKIQQRLPDQTLTQAAWGSDSIISDTNCNFVHNQIVTTNNSLFQMKAATIRIRVFFDVKVRIAVVWWHNCSLRVWKLSTTKAVKPNSQLLPHSTMEGAHKNNMRLISYHSWLTQRASCACGMHSVTAPCYLLVTVATGKSCAPSLKSIKEHRCWALTPAVLAP